MPGLAKSHSSTPLLNAAAVYLLLSLAAAQGSSPTAKAAVSSSSRVVSSSATARSTVSQPVSQPVSSTISCDRFRHTGFWDIDIDNRPALPPDCGPPFSLRADRNEAHLPVQIVGLFAGYVAFVVAVGISILTIRRRKSRSDLLKASLGLEMVKPEHKGFEISPNSPTPSHQSWMRNPLRKKGSTVASVSSGRSNSNTSALNSPVSVTNFDQKIVDNDRASRQAEMERLYAAVMEHDEARRSQLQVQQQQQEEQGESSQNLPERESAAGTKPTDKRLARVSKLDIPKTPISPVAPQSPIRAIYPPDHEFPFGQPPLSPTSPVTARVPKDWPPPTPGREPPTPGREPPTPGLGPPTPARTSLPNQMYPLSPGRTPLPNEMYSISPPPGTRQMKLPNEANPTSPTGPKAYLPDDMYPASPPVGQRKMTLPSSNEHLHPRSPGRADGMQPLSPGPLSPGRIDLPNDMYPASPPPVPTGTMGLPSPPVRGPASPRSFISRPGSTNSSVGKGRRILKNMRINTNMKVPDATDYEERTPLSATFKGQNDNNSTNNKSNQGREEDGARTPLTAATFDSTISSDRYESLDQPKPLPLSNPQRKPSNLTLKSATGTSPPSEPVPGINLSLPQSPYAGSQKSSSSNNALPLRAAGYDTSLTSPAPTKTTFLNRRAENLRRAGLMSARTPGTATGIPQTPYSAYMPFTPMTPVTPHLVTRKERKERQKIEKAEGRGRGLLDESDMVKEVEETWG